MLVDNSGKLAIPPSRHPTNLQTRHPDPTKLPSRRPPSYQTASHPAIPANCHPPSCHPILPSYHPFMQSHFHLHRCFLAHDKPRLEDSKRFEVVSPLHLPTSLSSSPTSLAP